MKNLLLIFLVFLSFTITPQLPYNWTPGVNPGWTSVNPGNGGGLQWRPACNAVTTNCVGNYSNNQNTTYTSPVIDASCTNASTVEVSFFLEGDVEFGWDFLFMEYSTDGGTTWINPYGAGFGLGGNAGAGIIWTLPPLPTSNNFRFRFTFTSDGSFRRVGYQITDFQIICNVVLPITLSKFSVSNHNNINLIEWETSSEQNNDFFTIQHSTNGLEWEDIVYLTGSGNSSQKISYEYKHTNFQNTINYYRLKQTDFDGQFETFKIVSVDNRSDKHLVKTINMMGQEVDETYKGIVIEVYNDGSIEKVYKQ